MSSPQRVRGWALRVFGLGAFLLHVQDNMRVRFLDWRASLSLPQRVERVERVAGAERAPPAQSQPVGIPPDLDTSETALTARESGGRVEGSGESASTAAETSGSGWESATDGVPPPVGIDTTYNIIIGSDIMYEVRFGCSYVHGMFIGEL
jgi:hypothetical protein